MLRQYEIIGRHYPNSRIQKPKLYKMKIFAQNAVVARSKYNYYMTRLQKTKKSNCQILRIKQIVEKRPLQVKNFGILLRFESRTGIHNVYKEYRDVTQCGAVQQMYNEMASRHAAQKTGIHIISVVRLPSKSCRRANVKAFHNPDLKFPLLHRKRRPTTRDYRTVFKAKRPSTIW
ncbi:putative 60S ribosomal protein L18a-2 [Monocercomonoides exilis]|uniref:putative 60S ribosomal protein L18a-2 n=1 Tax=Monocercomonoides exilis TaxID=2049356 RepID=UPI003559C654|nr:putative 60S ribosomal protein L18a-2 [Monocercomonoides exilis]KAH7823886.1 putative 60S ribosomal protein L18a-2 [Monocercomonoides exilis]KAH7827885.1 putative 60S ribosomal protein L18a-2 [Monocercomonoides exilis]|eukprot:MONOS_261.1-p1 / transcript=MONOS_261.1 / gene=MONOS_261 / organism=Monocercomonoides_exilis_PA203 / gene_product=60S ribosomal protein L18a-2 / transcript_product=60S ribosomal protein L18a-2 / location=Mono_scaffold00004:156364-157173(+) / protein_length=175 / sequence_SO=supercontig / SO=protein_coding / is_pseudo=false